MHVGGVWWGGVVCVFFFFFFNDTATTEIYTLSLHDALPICVLARALRWCGTVEAVSAWQYCSTCSGVTPSSQRSGASKARWLRASGERVCSAAMSQIGRAHV